MKSILGTSPITSIIGYVIAILTIAQPIISKDGFDIKRDWLMLLGAIAVAFLGRSSKDTNGVPAEAGKEMHAEVNVMKKALISHNIVAVQPEVTEDENEVEETEEVETAPVKKAKKKIVPVLPAEPIKKKTTVRRAQ